MGLFDRLAMCWLGLSERQLHMLEVPGPKARGVRRSKREYDEMISMLTPLLSDWGFDVYEVMQHPLIRGRPLAPVALTVLQNHDVLDGWRVDRATMERYLEAVEECYLANPYHNNVHAADVVQAVHCMLLMDLGQHLTKEDKFCLVVAAAVHDVGHPGYTNDFHVRRRDEVAFLYNDVSCNENLHARIAFQVADSPERDIFRDLRGDDFPRVRRTIIQSILATDMQQHFLLLELFEREMENCGTDLADWEDKQLLMKMALHLADLSNPARPVHLAQRWGYNVVTEMLRQEDVERSLGMAVSPVCDKDKVQVATAQLRFISYFLTPTLDAWQRVAPRFGALAKRMCERTTEAWKDKERAEAKSPKPVSQPEKAGNDGATE